MRKYHVGCSGFQYKNWNGVFYPKKTDLSYYAERIKSVEINYSFYNLPTPDMCRNWRERTPEDFTFVLKGNRVITHRRRINDSDVQRDYLDKFATAADQLGPKLVGVLWQFPPSFHATEVNQERLSKFQTSVGNRLPGNSFEFRHPSWYKLDHTMGRVQDLLERGNILVRHDHRDGPCMEFPRFTCERMFYTRYHGPRGDCRGSYTEGYLSKQAELHKNLRIPGMFYFNNDIDVGAPFDAQILRKML